MSQHLIASVTVTRRSKDGRDGSREVFWARRKHERNFLGGFHAFFAGAVEEGDADLAQDVADAFLRPFYGCAVRELLEESGLDVAPTRLVHLGSWRTPEWLEPFETHFFSVDVDDDEAETVVKGLAMDEFIEGEWLEPAEAIRRWERGEAFLTTPIEAVLRGLSQGSAEPLSLGSSTAPASIEVVGGLRILPLSTPTLAPATHTNCLILGGAAFVVIDPGTADAGELSKLFEVIDGLMEEGAQFKAVLLSHEHPDHVGGVQSVQKRYGVELWCHEETTERLPLDLYVARELEDDARIDLGPGQSLRVLHTPGHARGHLAFEHLPSRIVLAGDLVASKGTIVIDPPEGRMRDYLRSLERVRNLEPRALVPSHGWVITRPRVHLDGYIAHRWDRERRVEMALEQVARKVSPMELVPKVYEDIPLHVWPLASRSLEAHLEHLVERKVARKMGDDRFVFIGDGDEAED